MSLTWSVTNGGRLCTCGHMKCQHRYGKFTCIECEKILQRQDATDMLDSEKIHECRAFVDRAERAA